MKRVPLFKPEAGPPTYWRSLEHLAEDPQVKSMIEREFADGASTLPPTDRRTFLTLMSASFAAMGLAGCVRRPEEKIVPYQKMPENLIPGIPQFYATAIPQNGEAMGLLVECHEGRPTKIEGNPEHPASLGGSLPWLQALPLDLYDPDRLPAPVRVEAGEAAPAGSGGAQVDPRKPSKELPLPGHLAGVKATRASWDDALRELSTRLDALEKRGGAGLRVLIEPTSSPSLARMIKALQQRFPQAKVARYTSVSGANAAAGAKIAFGEPLSAQIAYDKATVVVAVDSDFLFSEPGAIPAAKGFAKGRKIRSEKERPNRLYVAEPAFSVTGMNADHRLQVPASQAEDFLAAVAVELGKKGVSLGALAGKLKPSGSLDPKFIAGVASDLAKNRGASVLVVGSRQPPAVHALAHALNGALGNHGKTIQFFPASEALLDPAAELKTLVDEMNKGQVDTLLVLGGNPVYTAPGDLKFDEAYGKVANRFYLASHLDETALIKGGWALPLAHDLESWGDLRAFDGSFSVQQPLIAPLFDGRSSLEILALAAKSKELKGHDIVRATFAELGFGVEAKSEAQAPSTTAPAASGSAAPDASASAPAASASASAVASASASAAPAASGSAAPAASGSAVPAASASAAASALASASASAPAPDAPPPAPPAPAAFPEKAWRRALHDGFLRGSKAAPVSPAVVLDAVAAAVGKRPAAALGAQSLEVTFAPDMALFDGRYANVAWLMELANPVTKMVWDNAAWISPKLAGELGVKSGEVLKLTADGRSIEIPVWVVPGTHPYSVQLHLGWGRKMLGRVASPEVGHDKIRGFNVGPLRSSAAMGFATGAKLEKGGASLNEYMLVVTQEHNMVDDGLANRPIVQEATLDAYRKDPTFTEKAVHHPPLIPLWPERKYEGYKWGLMIDLNACTGCGTCVVACQAENNIPAVGKEQVARQREMHWIRIDRYFSGSPEEPKVINQPMACVQCENAPCENVCPVNATSHSPEGLNEMTYNRCIGTRYCANNCPYKARRFNFLDYHEAVPETIKMVANPNVSVRMRGVMEKCTYCVQRIQAAKMKAKREGGRKLRDGEIITACQQACPSDAVVFGDLNDPNSRVAKQDAINRKFEVLKELNTKPRTNYLAKIRNPNPELA
jgi:molybdopterin-containing oxidoreductase family iron-sulfur binding subunit